MGQHNKKNTFVVILKQTQHGQERQRKVEAESKVLHIFLTNKEKREMLKHKIRH